MHVSVGQSALQEWTRVTRLLDILLAFVNIDRVFGSSGKVGSKKSTRDSEDDVYFWLLTILQDGHGYCIPDLIVVGTSRRPVRLLVASFLAIS
jgi:hypothetical protein